MRFFAWPSAEFVAGSVLSTASQDASERCPLRLEYVKGLSDTALPVLLG